jgi:Ca2+-binding RTX toxin-like protein
LRIRPGIDNMAGIRRRAVKIGVVFAVLVPVATAFAVTIAVKAPTNISKQAGYNAEGTIAVNPTDPTKVFAGFNNSDTLQQWARSSDSGATWVPAGDTAIMNNGGSCCDNVAEWDRFGNLYLVNLTADVNEIPLYLSTDDGASFSLLQTIDTGELDQPTLKAGPSSIWVTWNDSGLIKARGASVTGLGNANIGSFSTAQTAPLSNDVNGEGACQFGDIAVAPSGKVVDVCQTDTNIYSYTDPDGIGGSGFNAAVNVSPVNVDKFDPITPQPNRTIDSEANLAYDLSGGAHAGRVYMVYTDAPAPFGDPANNNTDIYLRHSDDDGATWSARVKVNDDATSTSQFFPVVTVDPTTGEVFVSWLDCRSDPTRNEKTEYWGAVSTDGGATFSPNVRLSAGKSTAAQQSDQNNEYGDYSGNDFYDGYGYAIWPDDSNSTKDNPDGTNEFDMYAGKLDTQACFGLRATVVGTTGTPGDDVIVGTAGADVIDGGGGNDRICGEGGNDTFLEGSVPNGADMISGGAGVDTVDYGSRVGNVVISLNGKSGKSGEKGEKDTLETDVENGTSGSGNDKLIGNDSPNTLTGGPGKDKLTGGNGSDTLIGTDGISGNDQLDGSKEKPVPLPDTCTGDNVPPKPDKIKNC